MKPTLLSKDIEVIFTIQAIFLNTRMSCTNHSNGSKVYKYIKITMTSEPLANVENLVVRFGDKVILDGVNLAIYPREIVTIIGGSGSGKTTLLKHMMGLDRPYSGHVQVFGKDWWEMGETEKENTQHRIGVLFQNGALLGSKTVAVNVAIPLEQHTKLPESVVERVVRLKLHQVGLEAAMGKMPSELSGGMRKRAALARALALDPPLILCDEPSAGLDPVTSNQLDSLLLNLRDNLGLTIVIVTHEIASIMRVADRIAYLEKGKIIFDGSVPEALKTDVESVRRFFEVGIIKDDIRLAENGLSVQ